MHLTNVLCTVIPVTVSTDMLHKNVQDKEDEGPFGKTIDFVVEKGIPQCQVKPTCTICLIRSTLL